MKKQNRENINGIYVYVISKNDCVRFLQLIPYISDVETSIRIYKKYYLGDNYDIVDWFYE